MRILKTKQKLRILFIFQLFISSTIQLWHTNIYWQYWNFKLRINIEKWHVCLPLKAGASLLGNLSLERSATKKLEIYENLLLLRGQEKGIGKLWLHPHKSTQHLELLFKLIFIFIFYFIYGINRSTFYNKIVIR